MTGNIKVGYMGIPFSNTEEMAITLTGDEGIDNIELVPLVSAANVVDALLSGSVNYGVLAIRNKFAGPVIESVLAQQGRNITVIRTKWCHIHHCVFTKNKDSEIRRLSSHIQALLQSEKNLDRIYPDAEWQECEDTAYAAEMLSNGKLSEDFAVVCRKDAGEHYGLYLAHENVEDNGDNMTEFSIIKKG